MFLLAAIASSSLATPVQLQLKPNLVITRSATVVKKVYRIPTSGAVDQPAITVKGNGIVVDFKNSTLEGSPQTVGPNQRIGLAILVEGRNVTIKNLRVRGYGQGLYARNCPGIRILDCDFSYNYKPHLLSTLEREDGSDWMSYHHNDKGEWLLGDEEYQKTGGRSGNPPKWPAVYLDGCQGFEVRGLVARDGQNALMLNRSNKGLVWNCDLSFNSGVGLAMYRSSDNRIMHNKIDWCVRGFSYGVYNRGQDSAGILIYEQSSRNVFAYNSVTHGGDGFFLWAGQTTMDTGEGGCNDNLLYGNDFSHAPTNGIEATFSRNNFVNNLVLECWHGVWGGYSYDSKVLGNVFGYNTDAIAWEHGQDNLVKGNFFFRDQTALRIWANKSQDPNWIYAKKRDTRNRDWNVQGNAFMDIPGTVLSLTRSLNFTLGQNRYGPANGYCDVRGPITNFKAAEAWSQSRITVRSSTKGSVSTTQSSQEEAHYEAISLPSLAEDGHLTQAFLTNPLPDISTLGRRGQYFDSREFTNNWNPLHYHGQKITIGTTVDGKDLGPIPAEALAMAPKPLKYGQDPFLKPGTLRGWRYMIVDEWGPYNFKHPLLWPREDLNPGVTGQYTRKRFEILGPKGRWRVASLPAGVTLSANHGTVPGTVDVSIPAGKASNVKIVLEYTGEATTDYRGIVTPAGRPVRFEYSKFFAPINWTIRFYKWTKSTDPADPHAVPDETAMRLLLHTTAPLKEFKLDRLDFAGSSFDAVTGNDHFLTIADGGFKVQPGDYTLELTTDDGARVIFDGKPLIADAWHYQGPTLYTRDMHLDGSFHTIRVEHFQIDGYAALKINLRPKK